VEPTRRGTLLPGQDRTLRGAGHLFFIEAAEETMTALSRFIHN
jgi:hypothetical protein